MIVKRQHNINDYLGLAINTLTHVTNFAVGAGESWLRSGGKSFTNDVVVEDMDISSMLDPKDPLFAKVKKCVERKVGLSFFVEDCVYF